MSIGNKQIMANNIKRLLEQRGLNGRQLALTLGFKYTTVNDWLNAKSYPRIDKIEKMANFFNVEKSDLVENKPHNLTSDKILLNSNYDKLNTDNQTKLVDYSSNLVQEQILEENKQSDSIVQFPKLFRYNYYDQPASAGTGQYLNDVQVEQIDLPVDVEADFVVPIYGDSMEPEYHSGDYVFVKLSVDLSNGDIGVFELYGDAYIKELVIDNSGAYLHSLNNKYEDISIDADSDFRIIGEVVGRYTPKS